MVTGIIEGSARHRGLVILAVAFAAAAAVWSIKRVKLDAIPDLSDSQVIVFTEWRGRSPMLIEQQVTQPLVAGLVSAPGVDVVRGSSMFGMSFVYVLFDEDVDLYWARSRVLEYLGQLRNRLPEGVSPELGPDATGVGWIFQYVLVDEHGRHGLDELRTYQDFELRYALGSVEGVAEVASLGGYQKQFQVVVDPARLRARGVSLDEVQAAVRGISGDVGGRVLEMTEREYYVLARGYVRTLSDLEQVVVRAAPGGTPIRVRDVAAVQYGPELRRGLLEWNGDGEAVGGIVVMRHGENALRVIERVKARLAELRPTLPAGVRVEIGYDRSALIERSVDTLTDALIEEAIVVALVVLLFLLHVRSALLPILSLPIAVGLAFIPMYLLDIPSTIMSLGGIAIAIGATVDAEIVMIEAAHKKLEHAPPGADRHRLLAEAAREVTPAIFFSLLIIAVAFLPVFTLTGQAGRLFKPLAYTKTFVMLASALLSITFAPALRDALIRGRIRPEHRHPVSRAIIAVYRPFVYVALRRPRSTVAIGALAVLSAIPLARELGSEFMPPLDEGDVLYMPITFPNLSIEEARRQLQLQDQALREVPEVASVFGKIGRAETATDPAPLTMVETTVRLRPRATWRKVRVERWYSSWAPGWLARAGLRRLWPEERPMTWDELTRELDARVRLPGWTNAWTLPIKARIDMLATGIRTPVGLKVVGKDLAQIEHIGVALEQILAPIRGTRSVLYERNQGGLYVDVVPRDAALVRYGVTRGDVQRLIELGVGGTQVATTIDGVARFGVFVRLASDARADLDALRRLPVPVPPAGFVPLGQLAEVSIVSGPPMVRDEDGRLVGYVYIDVDQAERDLGGYVAEAHRVVTAARARGELPADFVPRWTGQYEELEAMWARLKVIIPLTLFIVVLLLYLHFRDAMEVAIVLLSIPFALVGSVWMLWLLDYRLSTAVYVGIIALVGLAAQTGIVMIVYIDQAFERRRQAGKIRDLDDIVWAHLEGTVQRVRPKLMTVSTMLLGLVPLLWSDGTGADVMKRIAAPMVGGLLTSAFLTLEIIPVVYTYWRQEQLLHQRLRALDPARRARMRAAAWAVGGALLTALLVPVLPVYDDLVGLEVSWPWQRALLIVAAIVAGGGQAVYLTLRPAARRQVWPPAPALQQR